MMQFPWKRNHSPSLDSYLKSGKEVLEDPDVCGLRGNTFWAGEDSYRLLDIASDLVPGTEEARMNASVAGSLSPRDWWKKSWMRFRNMTPETAREAVWKTPGYREATQYKITYSHLIMDHFTPSPDLGPGRTSRGSSPRRSPSQTSPSVRVLDPCAGWGDRALGAYFTPKVDYTGVDPNPAMTNSYRYISSLAPSRIRVVKSRFEDFTPDGTYDLVFTSPPFSDYEVYTSRQDRNQSIYGRNHASWLKGWMFPFFSRCVSCCKSPGWIVLYLGDTTARPVVEPLKTYVSRAHPSLKFHQYWCQSGTKRKIPLLTWMK